VFSSRPNFIGETTPFTLPYSKTVANVSELYAPPTFEAYSQNRDPAMEAILSCREHLPGF
jgi:hypothetical protein